MGKAVSMVENKYRIRKILQLTGTLRKDQAMAINNNNPLSQAAIRESLKDRIAFRCKKDDNFICAMPLYTPRKRMTDAVDVLLQFIQSINIDTIYLPVGVAELGFMRNQKMYEIVYAKDKAEIKERATAIEKEYENFASEDGLNKSNLRYIFVLQTETTIDYMPEDVSYSFAFAVLDKTGEGMSPYVEFIIPNDEIAMEVNDMKPQNEEEEVEEEMMSEDYWKGN